MDYLFTVDDTFQIEDRGLILGHGLPQTSEITLFRGNYLILRRPDLSIVKAILAEIPMIRYRPDVAPEDRTTPIMLNKGISKSDVPIGTEVFLEKPNTEFVRRAIDVISRNSNVEYGIFGIIDSSKFFPPRELLNTFLFRGSDPCDQDARMDSWEPFELSEDEFDLLFSWWKCAHKHSVVDALSCDNWSDWSVEIIEG